jgi:uncharacterized protein YdgA (DUF945 family)
MRDESGLLVGGVKAGFGSLGLAPRQEGAAGIELDEGSMSQTHLVEAGNFGSELKLRVREIRLGDRSFGPGRIEAQLQNLDAGSLARLQVRGVGGLAPRGSRNLTQTTVAGEGIGLLSDLVSRSPHLEIHTFRLATPSGDLKAKLRIDLDGSRPDFLGELFTLLLVLELHAEVECPAEILDGLYQDRQEELLELRRQGWVLLDGDRYRSRLDFEGGQLFVNGLPKALGDLPGQPETPQMPEAPEPLPQISAVGSGPDGVAPGSELLP